MKKVKIAFDLDDVLIDLIPEWLDTLNKRHGTNKKPEDIQSWSISNYFKNDIEKGLLSKEEIYYPLREDEFWENVKPIDGMREMILVLKELGNYDIYIATASNYHTIKSKIDNCVMKYYGDIIDEKHIILINDKSMLNADILIDDYFGNISNFLKTNPKSIGLLKDTTHSDIDYDAVDNDNLPVNSHLKRLFKFKNSYELLALIMHATRINLGDDIFESIK